MHNTAYNNNNNNNHAVCRRTVSTPTPAACDNSPAERALHKEAEVVVADVVILGQTPEVAVVAVEISIHCELNAVAVKVQQREPGCHGNKLCFHSGCHGDKASVLVKKTGVSAKAAP